MLKHGKGLPGAPRARLVVGVGVVYRTAQLFENLLNANGHGAPRFSEFCGEDDMRGMWASLSGSLFLEGQVVGRLRFSETLS